ncbi:2-dehydropantoate 2-reductase [Methanomicrobiaceae archaeon CYW5]|uniref:ketopantoate reductase family protein n=1 Tax=Methanovulcanius yangii TaxID=1789227 RepID=UPI0029C9BC98|nr:ketopantoate reductase family protein [Methanovulcanius yangii]MBT8507069.1 2-dehydropantoate 2-reductase [Methanovulcanius yangii]
MRIAVLGAGAVGLSIAARLSTACDVYAVARPRHIAAIERGALRLTGLWGDELYTFPCGTDLPADDYDYILITSKSLATRSICEEFGGRFGDAEVVSIQNGIGNEEIIHEYTPNVIGGMIITGFEWRGDADVHVSVIGGNANFGRFPDGEDEPVCRLVSLFEEVGIGAESHPSIRTALWGKTLYNAALNPLGAIMNVPYGALKEPHAWHIIEQVVTEGFAAASADGVMLEWASPEEYLEYLANIQIPATAQHRSSMLQDITAGRITEIDFINGAIVRIGERYGIDTTVNNLICDLIHFRESSMKK